MNCVLYGLARAAKGDTEVYLVRDGYLGLVRGGHSCIQLANADEIEQYLHQVRLHHFVSEPSQALCVSGWYLYWIVAM